MELVAAAGGAVRLAVLMTCWPDYRATRRSGVSLFRCQCGGPRIGTPRPGRARNLADRINEAEQNGWSGEAEGLQVSLTAAQGNSPP